MANPTHFESAYNEPAYAQTENVREILGLQNTDITTDDINLLDPETYIQLIRAVGSLLRNEEDSFTLIINEGDSLNPRVHVIRRSDISSVSPNRFGRMRTRLWNPFSIFTSGMDLQTRLIRLINTHHNH